MSVEHPLVPSVDGSPDRDTLGRFRPGNAGGKGNPHARRVARLRAELLKTVNTEDIREIVRVLIEKAKAGDVLAAREILDRVLGKATLPVQVAGRLDAHQRDAQKLKLHVYYLGDDGHKHTMIPQGGRLVEVKDIPAVESKVSG